jgi:xanthine dehydrogenase small subunit
MAGRLYNLADPECCRSRRHPVAAPALSRPKTEAQVSLAYQRFSDPQAASRFLAQREEARLLGGGTLLVRCVNEGDVSIGAYVRLLAPELQQIEVGDDAVRLGAAVTMSRIARVPTLAFLAPVARSIGGPAVRAAATVGGNLFAPSPYGDFGVALLALDAVVAIEGPEGASELDLESFFKSRARLARGTIVTAVRFLRPQPGDFRFVKVSRVKPKGTAVVSLAARLSKANGRVSAARVALGAMAPTPIRARGAEEALMGTAPTTADIHRAAVLAAADASPSSDAIASAWYRNAVLPVHLLRLLST